MDQLRTVIVEDEPAVRKELAWLVAQEERLKLEGTASSVETGLQVIRETSPDLVLMDIQLTDGTGFDILKQLGDLGFRVIFVTAYDQFAIKAIKCGALDYLLKPVDGAEFSAAIGKLNKAQNEGRREQINIARAQHDARGIGMDANLCVASADCVHIVRLNEIVYLSGEGSYTKLHLENNRKVTASKPLKYYEELLPEGFFIRTHQSYVVNKTFVDKYLKTGVMVMKDRSEIPVATRRKEFVLDQLSTLK